MVNVLYNVLGFFRQWKLCSSFTLGRGQPTIFWAVLMTPLERFPLSRCAAGVPYAHAVCQYALSGGTIKGHKQSLRDVIRSECSQQLQALLGLFSSSAVFTLQHRISSNVDSQQEKVCHPLHTVPTDD